MQVVNWSEIIQDAEQEQIIKTNYESELFMKPVAKWASPLFQPSSVNYSFSVCAVVYSFPAVKGCPLKVPFVHKLHFVIQIALFKMARGCRLPPSAGLRQKINKFKKKSAPLSNHGQLFPFALINILTPLPPPFQSRIYIQYIYI